ncbi:uncharacterized protein LOC128983703 [Macrosteles quadrilineatus]|uniref:uncharacterized protein LOC128983142 n=1 Tax=Macrosteles quadrilineatus TaxID=74068 RepID=UPI0023E23CA0|nr:uncharacterized protein LOC128983142 [Macrosteles quadrilineatus]XP_054259080.1 uncharacterized protein LOC128983703 [Macrosteles quadrilineatus]
MNEEKRSQLERNSRGQSLCDLWVKERKKRITASNFGRICKMRSTTSCQKLVEQLLYKQFSGNSATRMQPFLAASPDGVIEGLGLVEVKCPASAKDLTPADAVVEKKIKFCVLDEERNLKLKRSHCYYYQIQGQLHITQQKNCWFLVWTNKGMSIEKIVRDDQFWENKMEKPLTNFYFKCVLPELIDPRHPRGLPIRDRF